MVATGAPSNIPGVPAGFRANQLPDPAVNLSFLDMFGRAPRESPCECERSSEVSLGQTLTLVNGPTVSEAIIHPQGLIARLVNDKADSARMIEEVYLSVVSRPPILRALGGRETPPEVVVDGRTYRRDVVFKHDSWAATALYGDAGGNRITCTAQEGATAIGLVVGFQEDNTILPLERVIASENHIDGPQHGVVVFGASHSILNRNTIAIRNISPPMRRDSRVF